MSLETRFWSKVDKSGECWLWTGALSVGYGQFWSDGKVLKAHRVVWEMANGPIPAGLQVLHRCDNPPCVRPDHLFAGSQHDNMVDASSKGRFTFAKLTTSDVIELRKAAAQGVSEHVLARRFGVSLWTIRDAVSRRNWAHVA